MAQVPLAKDNDMIKTFPSDRAPVTNAHGTKPPGENFAIDPVTIADDVAWIPFPAEGFGELPGHPFGGRVCRHAQP